MITTFDDICDAAIRLPKGDQMRLLLLVALEVVGAHPGIDFQEHVCGGAARFIRTRIPVWLLEAMRRDGRKDAGLLADYPTLTAEDLANSRLCPEPPLGNGSRNYCQRK
jgi:uncharacterized protein (DUF433 family)